MHRLMTMKRLSVLFLATFAVLLVGVFAYQALVVAPEDRCEAGGGWWDAEGAVCARPISVAEKISELKGLSRAEASNLRNRELVELEDRLAAARDARNAEVERERAALAGR
ncbi:hypothetical protein [Brevundimonas sp.]|uniref:hypothetical protein n=1 Tax=Brevundimonas sp. TaxID=1871086 RepID=UPI002D6FB122|nr:hypothetical protein [Brevundimonas sp.]HYC97095.1 hypothetical protein [Brevundimonas sp.]